MSSLSIDRRIQFSETDMAGVVHFANYFRMMEEVEHAFFRSLGLSVSMQWEGQHVSWPRVAASCDYLGPIRFEDEIELRLRVTKVGSKSLSYEVDFLKEGKAVAMGRVTSVCVEMRPEGFVSIAIPAGIREKLESANGV